MNAPVSMTMDTRGLERAILEVVPETRRTVAEQCVTSLGMILQDTQTYGSNVIPFVDIGRMDADLDAEVGKSKLTEGEKIVLARTNPDSDYNKETGGRWALMKPDFGSGPASRFAPRQYQLNAVARRMWREWLANSLNRMRNARHSSGHFIQSGFKAAIKFCVTSPLFKNRYRAQSRYANANPLNRLDSGQLGDAMMTPPDSPNFSITAENNVGQDGNAVLDAKHREALIAYASGPLQDAIDKEREIQVAELEKRLAVTFEKTNKMLS